MKEGPGLCLTLAVGSGKETSKSRTEETGSEPAAVTRGSVLVRASRAVMGMVRQQTGLKGQTTGSDDRCEVLGRGGTQS